MNISLVRSFVLCLVVFILVALESGCVGVTAAKPAVVNSVSGVLSVAINPSSVSVHVGGSQQFSATISGSADTGVTWSASAGSVSSAGLYTAPSTAGNYAVTATSVVDPTKSATATVSVTSAEPGVAVTVSPGNSTLAGGSTKQFVATVSGSTNTTVTWSATGGSITSSGLYTAPLEAGTYSVFATSSADSSKSAVATVTVTSGAATVSVAVTPGTVALQTGSTLQFIATVNGTTNKAVTWSSTGGSISTSGLYVAPKTAGTYVVKAVSVADSAKSSTATVTVTTTPPPIAVAITPNSASLQTGAVQQFTAIVSGSTNTGVTWSATSGTVSSSGLFSAPAIAGNYKVTATSNADKSKSASANVTVNARPVAVTISPSLVAIQTGASQQFSATVTGSANTSVTWSANAGTINSAGLYIAPGTAGTYSVIATAAVDKTKSAAVTVNVSAPPTPIAVSISPASTAIQAGATQQFKSTVTGTSNTAVTWSATGGIVSSSGLYTAPATAGTYTIKATSAADATKSASASVTVATTPAKITISPSSLSFGSVAAKTSATQVLRISNSGGSTLSLTGAAMSGTGFSITGVNFPIAVNAGQSTNLTVQFAPPAAGNYSGSVSISSNAGTSAAVALSGSATTSVSHSVTLNWTPSASSVVGYFVYRGTQSGGPYTRLQSTAVPTTTYTDSSVASGTTYYYVVTAVNSGGAQSSNSNQATAVIP